MLQVPSVRGATTALVAGGNEVGQLGMERASACRFVPITDLQEKIVSCAAGGMHSLLLSEHGKILSFGCNDDGSLGRLTEEEEECFKAAVVHIEGETVSKIAAGNIHSVALTTDCHVFIWGSYRDNSGAFGISPKNPEFISEPMKLSLPDSITDIACGADHTLMLSQEGVIYTMGIAEQGRLGRIRKSHCCRENRRARQTMLTPLPMRVRRYRKPVLFDGIWAGRFSGFARSVSDGRIWGWGLNNYHQLGEINPDDHEDNFVYQPVELAAFDPKKRWTQICGGEQHTLALDSEGTVYSMGRPLYGRLGLGPADANDPDVTKLTPVPGLEECVVSIAAGDNCSFAIHKSGQLLSWGQGTNMLGQGDREIAKDIDLYVPTQCASKHLKDKTTIEIAAGSHHAICIASG
ncbi:regulator of chromosome condensation isoform X2 [Galendromus occidentalis]|uniref:Regulator of chromosome condensation isoform X2 n=1 Tax=Galendromus occidentalis TaxID=34638 RepID=A0AAJ6QYQ6_9ACAR|nr:regulator of chromosome condensation isoform X2 [Galendromus occidentalis]